MKRIALIITLIIVIAFMGGVWFNNQNTEENLGTLYRVPVFRSVNTSQVTADVATSTVVLTSKSLRRYVSICSATNDSGLIHLNSTATTSTAYGSIRIPAYGCYEIDQDNLYTGEIRFVPTTATTTLQVVEFIGN